MNYKNWAENLSLLTFGCPSYNRSSKRCCRRLLWYVIGRRSFKEYV